MVYHNGLLLMSYSKCSQAAVSADLYYTQTTRGIIKSLKIVNSLTKSIPYLLIRAHQNLHCHQQLQNWTFNEKTTSHYNMADDPVG